MRHYPQERLLEIYRPDKPPLHLTEVVDFWFDFFSPQNVLFDIYRYPAAAVPSELLEDYPWLGHYREQACTVYRFAASAGCDGVAVCRTSGGLSVPDLFENQTDF
ncbi:hypothetical protein [Neisseria sp.]|uniref:hypothetical protein n=1 Tax=Neisseria sp. TaxID=192066 RepID=UPI00359F403F